MICGRQASPATRRSTTAWGCRCLSPLAVSHLTRKTRDGTEHADQRSEHSPPTQPARLPAMRQLTRWAAVPPKAIDHERPG